MKALGTPTAALIGACIAGFIAYRQMRTARNKPKLDLFDKRMEVYNAALEMIVKHSSGKEISPSRSDEIAASMNAASWLLNPGVEVYLQEMRIEIRLRRNRKKEGPVPTKEGVVDSIKDGQEFRTRHMYRLREIFEPFLKLEH